MAGAFAPGRLGSFELCNRVIRARCVEGLSQGGHVTEALIERHRRVVGDVTCVSENPGLLLM